MSAVVKVNYTPSPTFEKFHKDQSMCRFVGGPVGCVAPETLVVTEFGAVPIWRIDRPMRVLSWNERTCQFQLSWCGGSFPKGVDYLHRISTPTEEFDVAAEHLLYDEFCEYRPAQTVARGQALSVCSVDPQRISEELVRAESPIGVPRLLGTAVDSLAHYAASARQYGLQLLRGEGIDLEFVPSPAGVGEPWATQEHDQKHGGNYTAPREPLTKAHVTHTQRGDTKRSYWDLQVLDTNNYVTVGGAIHHNSGKSAGMVMEILLKGMQQQPFRGVRKTRVAVIRNTFSELRHTTIKTFTDWIPPEICSMKMTAPPTAHVSIPDMGDGTAVDIEVIFLALDREEDQKKMRSLEVSFVWINECQFIATEIIRVALQRTGRYPKMEQDDEGKTIPGTGATWSGLIADFNMVDNDHDLYKALMTEKRSGWKFWRQPAAIEEIDNPSARGEKMWAANPDAENVGNLPGGHKYYLDKLPGMKRSQILVDFCAQWGVSAVGQPVYAETYDDEYHIAEEELKVDKSLPVYMGIDFGLHPAIVFGQVMRDGRLVILKEIDPNQPSGVSLEEFLEDWYRPFVLEHFVGVRNFEGWGDPAGRGRSAIDKRSPFMVLSAAGIRCVPTMTNEFLPRKEAVEKFLMKRNGILINPSCVRIRKGFLGGYGYKKINGLAKTHPEKNSFSHCHDSLQYLCLGLVTQGRRRAVTQASGGGIAF